ncbi:hypothetical protein GCM10007067_22410 [Lysobacter bugurensis]|uniref:Integrase DNA-binding domain-containing protein n=1 Tax=Cognatilysobacter bugurensis TaxID=543356 RepID=A0A918T2A6_9GAMM|nr:hypothetical protein GCM10007067_22410 [Lysobacter bugurensis]
MASGTGKLTAIVIKAAAPGKLFDGGGLYLHVRENGARYWRVKYRHLGREGLLSFGVYPEVSLAEARRRRDEARATTRGGRDTGAVKRERKLAAVTSAANSLEAVATEFLGAQRRKLAFSTFAKSQWILRDNVCAWLGSHPLLKLKLLSCSPSYAGSSSEEPMRQRIGPRNIAAARNRCR